MAGAADHVTGGATWMTYREIAAARGISHAAAIRLVQRHRWQKREGSNDGLAHVLVPHDAAQPTPPVRRPRHADPAPPSQRSPTTPSVAAAFESALAAIEAAHARELATLKEQVASAEQARIAMQALVEQFAGQLRDADETMKSERARHHAEMDDAQINADRAEAAVAAEYQRAADLRAQIDELNAEMVVMRAETDRALAEEQLRADRFSEQVDAGHRDLDAARADVERLERDRAAAVAIADEAVRAAEALRQSETDRKARGLVARLRAAWRGE